MNTLIHLVKFNFIFYRLRFILITLASLGVLIFSFFSENTVVAQGQEMARMSGSFLVILFAARISAKSSLYMDMKHLVALPLSHYEVVLVQSIADAALLFPLWSSLILGLSMAYEQLFWPFIAKWF